MSTVFLGLDFSRDKFPRRAAEWRRASSYRQRQVLRRGKLVDLVEYKIPTVIPANKGRKILWFSDLHFWGDLEIDVDVASESLLFINELQPDYLVYGGDLVKYSSVLPRVRVFFKALPENSRKMAVMGNWEYARKWLKLEVWREFYTSCGFELLVNESREFDELFFYGVDDLRKGNPEIPAEIPDNKEIIFLAHSPDAFIHIGDGETLEKTNLVLCGHTHGGQIRIPFFGALLTSSRYWRKFAYGHFVNPENKCNMLVSGGLGCSTLPIRIACRRELMLVNLV